MKVGNPPTAEIQMSPPPILKLEGVSQHRCPSASAGRTRLREGPTARGRHPHQQTHNDALTPRGLKAPAYSGKPRGQGGGGATKPRPRSPSRDPSVVGPRVERSDRGAVGADELVQLPEHQVEGDRPGVLCQAAVRGVSAPG